jgi:hypothetical protein
MYNTQYLLLLNQHNGDDASQDPDIIYILKIGYIGSSMSGCYYLQYVPTSKPFGHAWVEVLEALTLYSVLDPITVN